MYLTHITVPVQFMTTQTATYLDAILHLPEGATLALVEVSWYEYEELTSSQPTGRAYVCSTTEGSSSS